MRAAGGKFSERLGAAGTGNCVSIALAHGTHDEKRAISGA